MKALRPLFAAAATAAALTACSPADTTSSLSAASVSSALSTASGLSCAPDATATAACTGKAKGDACTFTAHDGNTAASTCQLAADGTTLACAPPPHTLPAFLSDACTGKAAADACTATLPNGETFTGVCLVPDADDLPASGTLICGKVHTPPAEATAACTGLTANAACTFSLHGYAITGTCKAPTGSTTLSCTPACGQVGGGGHGGDCGGDHGHGGHGGHGGHDHDGDGPDGGSATSTPH